MMICSKILKPNRLSRLLNLQKLAKFSEAKENSSNSTENKARYQSPVVEQRFYKKPSPKFLLGEILRIEYVTKNYEEYYETEGIIAGWARTVR